MVQPLAFINIPPGNVWELYVLFLLIPGIMRVCLLAKPFFSVTKQLAPHGGWVLKRLKDLPVKGYTLLAVNEILSFSLPPDDAVLLIIVTSELPPIASVIVN